MKLNTNFLLYCAVSIALCSLAAYFLSSFYTDHINQIYSYENALYSFLIFSLSVVSLWLAFKKID